MNIEPEYLIDQKTVETFSKNLEGEFIKEITNRIKDTYLPIEYIISKHINSILEVSIRNLFKNNAKIYCDATPDGDIEIYLAINDWYLSEDVLDESVTKKISLVDILGRAIDVKCNREEFKAEINKMLDAAYDKHMAEIYDEYIEATETNPDD